MKTFYNLRLYIIKNSAQIPSQKMTRKRLNKYVHWITYSRICNWKITWKLNKHISKSINRTTNYIKGTECYSPSRLRKMIFPNITIPIKLLIQNVKTLEHNQCLLLGIGTKPFSKLNPSWLTSWRQACMTLKNASYQFHIQYLIQQLMRWSVCYSGNATWRIQWSDL